MLSSGALSLAEFPGPMLEVHCPRCNPHGRYSKARLRERYGPDISLRDLLHRLYAGRTRRPLVGEGAELRGVEGSIARLKG
jgi:hypothetical protein